MDTSRVFQMELLLPVARKVDPVTSHMAGANVQRRVNGQKWRLLLAYAGAEDGLTDEQAAMVAGLADVRGCCWWKRCSELRELGMIRPTGMKRMSTLGELRQVCGITDDGRRTTDDGWRMR